VGRERQNAISSITADKKPLIGRGRRERSGIWRGQKRGWVQRRIFCFHLGAGNVGTWGRLRKNHVIGHKKGVRGWTVSSAELPPQKGFGEGQKSNVGSNY